MAELIIVLVFVALALAGARWGVDSRSTDDARDRFWWPNR